MNLIRTAAAGLLIATSSLAAHAAESYDNCTGFIESVPATISTQGTWCLRKDVATSIDVGAAITVAANNVTIDCNDFKVGGLGAGIRTMAIGVVSYQQMNTSIRNCSVRGFLRGMDLTGSGIFIEDNRLDGNTHVGIKVSGDGSVVRRNHVADTGGSTLIGGTPMPFGWALGIVAHQTVDVIDNTVTGVLPAGADGAVGIWTENNLGGSISGNRVRGLSTFEGGARGIANWSAGRMIITGNHLIGDGKPYGRGISCEMPSYSRAEGNVVLGFAFPIDGCPNDSNGL